MEKKLWFDMDGTIADLYGVAGWFEALTYNADPSPYIVAKPLLNMAVFARLLHKAQRLGYSIGIISWTAKDSTQEYANQVEIAKLEWLRKHLPSVEFDNIIIVPYGTPKSQCGSGFLFDDDSLIREEWGEGMAYFPSKILEFLRDLK